MSQQHPKIPSFSAAHDTPKEVIPLTISFDDLLKAIDQHAVHEKRIIQAYLNTVLGNSPQATIPHYQQLTETVNRSYEKSMKTEFNIQSVNTINNNNYPKERNHNEHI